MSPKTVIKRQTSSAWNVLQPSIPVCRGPYIPTSKSMPPFSAVPSFFEEYLKPQVRINKTVNKHTVNYLPSTSQLTSRIFLVKFMWTTTGFISPEFLNFSLNLYIPPWLRKNFKLMVLRLLANTFVSQKSESVHFYPCLQVKLSRRFLSLPPRQKEITHSSRTAFSEDLFFPQQKGGEDYGVEKVIKIKPTRNWSHILINSTIFATFTYLVTVLFCHN